MPHRSLQLAVGRYCPNRQDDVESVQKLLNQYAYATHKTLRVDGIFGMQTEAAIREFQRTVLVMRFPDGVVSTHGITLERLNRSSAAPPSPTPQPTPIVPVKPKTGSTPSHVLSESDYEAAAKVLGCNVAAIKAVAATETGICGVFDKQGRPSILYERHYFSRLTKRRYDRTHSDIANSVSYANAEGYGRCSVQYEKLGRASQLDRSSALMSASWGAFQLMGEYYQEAGYSSIDGFVAGMQTSVQEQLTAFVHRILSNKKGAQSALQQKNWTRFADAYNGPHWRTNHYDTKMAENYAAAGGK